MVLSLSACSDISRASIASSALASSLLRSRCLQHNRVQVGSIPTRLTRYRRVQMCRKICYKKNNIHVLLSNVVWLKRQTRPSCATQITTQEEGRKLLTASEGKKDRLVDLAVCYVLVFVTVPSCCLWFFLNYFVPGAYLNLSCSLSKAATSAAPCYQGRQQVSGPDSSALSPQEPSKPTNLSPPTSQSFMQFSFRVSDFWS